MLHQWANFNDSPHIPTNPIHVQCSKSTFEDIDSTASLSVKIREFIDVVLVDDIDDIAVVVVVVVVVVVRWYCYTVTVAT